MKNLKLKELVLDNNYNYAFHPMSGYGRGTGFFKLVGLTDDGNYLVRLDHSKLVTKVNKHTFISITSTEDTQKDTKTKSEN